MIQQHASAFAIQEEGVVGVVDTWETYQEAEDVDFVLHVTQLMAKEAFDGRLK